MATSITERRSASPSSRRPKRAPAAEVAPAERVRRPFTVGTCIALVLMILGGLVGAFAAFMFYASGIQQSRNQAVMYEQLRTDLAQAIVPVSGIIAPGTPLGLIEIPAIDLQQVFVEGSSSEQTIEGPGLRLDSVLPGQAGVSILIGRRSTFGAPFANLDQLDPGDVIRVTTGQGVFMYTIDVVRTTDAPDTSIESTKSRLSLMTSDPAVTPNRKLVVSAQIDGKVLPASVGITAPPNNDPGAGSKARLIPLLLWSQLLLVVTIVVTWASTRVPGRVLWIGAAPIFAAILWNVFENVAILLPNTL